MLLLNAGTEITLEAAFYKQTKILFITRDLDSQPLNDLFVP